MSVSEKLTVIAENEQKVYEAGKKAQYDEFWDAFQVNGERQDYTQAFSYTCWNNHIFKPKYQLKPTKALQMFYRNTSLSGEIPEIINIDFSNCTDMTQVFQDLAGVTRLGVLDVRKVTISTNAIIYCHELVTIDKIIIDESSGFILGFSQCTSLKNIIVEGIIAKTCGFGTNPLTVESIKNIISHLKDYTETEAEYTYTATFKASAFEALETEGFTEDDKTWLEKVGISYSEDLTWAMVVDDFKWNLTLKE